MRLPHPKLEPPQYRRSSSAWLVIGFAMKQGDRSASRIISGSLWDEYPASSVDSSRQSQSVEDSQSAMMNGERVRLSTGSYLQRLSRDVPWVVERKLRIPFINLTSVVTADEWQAERGTAVSKSLAAHRSPEP